MMSNFDDMNVKTQLPVAYSANGQMLKVALKYDIGEWPAMKRVLECGDVELSNNLREQMMRRIKMNLKNACNIGGEISAKHNAFMFSGIESCKMMKRKKAKT